MEKLMKKYDLLFRALLALNAAAIIGVEYNSFILGLAVLAGLVSVMPRPKY